jgi:hypothetical protein
VVGDGGEDRHTATPVFPIGKLDALDKPQLAKDVLGHAVCGFSHCEPIVLCRAVVQANLDKMLADTQPRELFSHPKQ